MDPERWIKQTWGDRAASWGDHQFYTSHSSEVSLLYEGKEGLREGFERGQ